MVVNNSMKWYVKLQIKEFTKWISEEIHVGIHTRRGLNPWAMVPSGIELGTSACGAHYAKRWAIKVVFTTKISDTAVRLHSSDAKIVVQLPRGNARDGQDAFHSLPLRFGQYGVCSFNLNSCCKINREYRTRVLVGNKVNAFCSWLYNKWQMWKWKKESFE